jgi:glycosyltransferase involved in cell wall biosynthesis
VVVSDRGALPEVVGEAGLVVDPSDPASAAQVVSELLADTGTLESQRKRSLVRSERFSWEVAAEKIVSLLRGFTGAGKTSGR